MAFSVKPKQRIKLDKKTSKQLKRLELLPTRGEVKKIMNDQKQQESRERLWASLSPWKKLKVMRRLAKKKGEQE